MNKLIVCFLFFWAVSLNCFAVVSNVSFHEAMKPSNRYKPAFVESDKDWSVAKKLYDQHIYEGLKLSEEPKIPKIIHHIWIGSNLPTYAENFRNTWVTHHPEWTFIFWTDHPHDKFGTVTFTNMEDLTNYLNEPNHEQFIIVNLNALQFDNRYAYDHVATNYGEKSDVLRYEVLFKLGGLYVDTDFECHQPFDELHHACDFFTGIAYDRKFVLFNGLIASKVGCPIMRSAVEALRTKKYTGASFSYSGPYFFTECFNRHAETYDGKAVALPVTYLYPWPNRYRKQSIKKAKAWLKPESLALHYWKYSWSK